MGFPTLIRVVIQSYCFMILVILATEILYSCGSLPSSATPEYATGRTEAGLLLLWDATVPVSSQSVSHRYLSWTVEQAVPVITGGLIGSIQAVTFTDAFI